MNPQRMPTEVLLVRDTKTIQTHTAVSVPLSGQSPQPSSANTNANGYMDCTGYDQISITLQNDAATASTVDLCWSNDGTIAHGTENVLPSASATTRAARTGTKAKYCKVLLSNGDSALAHTMNAWAYLTS